MVQAVLDGEARRSGGARSSENTAKWQCLPLTSRLNRSIFRADDSVTEDRAGCRQLGVPAPSLFGWNLLGASGNISDRAGAPDTLIRLRICTAMVGGFKDLLARPQDALSTLAHKTIMAHVGQPARGVAACSAPIVGVCL